MIRIDFSLKFLAIPHNFGHGYDSINYWHDCCCLKNSNDYCQMIDCPSHCATKGDFIMTKIYHDKEKYYCKYKLCTEEQLNRICIFKPELKKYTFKGYCIQTNNSLLYGSKADEKNLCLNCFPNSHFYAVPLSLLEEKKTPLRVIHLDMDNSPKYKIYFKK